MDSEISKWYGNQHILVTGATGFMGKILVEKLLRSCPDVTAIYLLIRSRKGRDPAQRVEDFINSPIFDKIRDQPEGEKIFEKIHCINGDITVENLNLSNDDQKTLQDNVDTIFHMAANVRFDQPLKSALLMNTGGTKRVLDLACTFQKLKAFVHVSTSYCHCNETILEEKTYAAPHNPRKMLELVTWMDNELLEMLTPRLLKNAPNTYAYTKCLTEQLVAEYSKVLPVAITRPSVVTASLKEPLPGWVDNLNGPTGLLVGAGKGVIRTMHCNPDLEADIIPVDIAINKILIVGYHLGANTKTNDVQVYHITANKEHLIKWGEALDIGRKHFYNNPFSVCLWYPGGSIKSSFLVHTIAAFFFHLIPAYAVDFLLVLTGYKPFLVRTQQRIKKGLDVLQYYTTRPWQFHNDKMNKLIDSLNRTDRAIFYTQGPMDYDKYLLDYILGARKYCVHEEPDTIPYAKKVLQRLYYLDVFKNVVLGVFVLWFFSKCATAILTQIA